MEKAKGLITFWMVTKTQQLLKFVCSAWVQYSQLCALTGSRGHADTLKSNHMMSTTGIAATAPVIKIHPDTNNPIKAWDKLKVRSSHFHCQIVQCVHYH